jgi:hypothetical protein
MNNRQLVGTLLIVISAFFFSVAAYNTYVFNPHGLPFNGHPNTLPLIVGIVLLIVGIIFVVQARSNPWF